MSAMFAVYRRDQGAAGVGQEIDVSLYEPLFRLAEAQVIGFDQLGIVKQRQGNRLAEDSPRNTYETSDGLWIGISASSQRTFERLCEAMEMPELIGDPRYASNALRCANADDLDAAMAAWFRRRRCDEVMRLFDEAHVVAGPVLTIADIVKDPHYAARADIVAVPDDDFGEVRCKVSYHASLARQARCGMPDVVSAPTTGRSILIESDWTKWNWHASQKRA